jgi:uncharacterized protein YndB with AHSA1/START domain
LCKTAPVVTAVTRISAPVEHVWRVLIAFDEYAHWHPVLSLDAKPEQVVVGAKLPGRVSGAGAREPARLTVSLSAALLEARVESRSDWQLCYWWLF